MLSRSHSADSTSNLPSPLLRNRDSECIVQFAQPLVACNNSRKSKKIPQRCYIERKPLDDEIDGLERGGQGRHKGWGKSGERSERELV